MEHPPFPPYTRVGLARRFPGDYQAHKEVSALRCWLYDQEALEAILARTALSRRTLYRLRERWEQHGLSALLNRPTGTQRVSMPLVRASLRILARGTPFMLGCDPQISRIIPHPDPAQRGQIMTHALAALIHELDRSLHATRGVSGLIERRYVRGESLDEIAATVHSSTRTVSRLSQLALKQITRQLSATLERTTIAEPWSPWLTAAFVGRDDLLAALERHLCCEGQVGMVGLAGIGKSTIAAYVAHRWQRAGWNICWLRVRPIRGDMGRDLVEQLYSQLAGYGAIDAAKPDSSLALMDQVSIVRTALQRVPTLLVIDDVHYLDQSTEATTFFYRVARSSETIRIIIIGRTMPQSWEPELIVEGLLPDVARNLYTRLHGSITDAEWNELYPWHRGNPQLLQLTPRVPRAPGVDAQPTYAIICDLISSVSSPARRILQWLWWWDEPLPTQHPFRRAIPGSQAAWQELVRYHLVTVRDNTYLIHDLIRDHLKSITSSTEWQGVREQIRQYVALHARNQPWACRLGYHCAVDTEDWASQIHWSGELARLAEREAQPHQAMFWWNRQWESARHVGDQQSMISAALAGAVCGVALIDGPATMRWIERLPADLDAVQQWYAALYRVQALRLVEEYDQGYQILQSAPLADAIPADIDAGSRWRYQVELVYWTYSRGNWRVAWQHYQALPPPPRTSTFYQQTLYYRLGVILARTNYAYYDCLRISRAAVKLADRTSSAFLSAQATLTLIYSLITTEQYRAAETKLNQLMPSLDDSWLALKQRAAAYQSLLQCYQGNLRAGQDWVVIARSQSEALGWSQDYFINWLQGFVAFRCGQPEQALAYFAADIEPIHLVSQWTWLAEVLVYLERPQEAHAYLRKILDDVRRQRDQATVWDLHVLWGDLQQLYGNTQRALRHFCHTGAIYSGLKLPVKTAEAYGRVAECYLALNQPQRALHYSLQATAKIQSFSTGLLLAPRIWRIHALALHACGEDALPAWHIALRHVKFQALHAPETVSVEHILDQPYYRDIVSYGGGAAVVAAKIRQSRKRRGIRNHLAVQE